MSVHVHRPIEVETISPEEARQILDEQARELLGISGDEFLRAYKAGEYNGREEDTRVVQLATLIGLAA